MILQVTALEDLTFSSIDVSHPGRNHDAYVFHDSQLFVESGGRIDHIMCSSAHHILGDGAYPTKSYLLKPYKDLGDLTRAQRRFNFIHASVRSVAERAIGRLKGRFRRLKFVDC